MTDERRLSVLALVTLRSDEGRGEAAFLRQCLAIAAATGCPLDLLLCADPRAAACEDVLRVAAVGGVRRLWRFDDSARGAASDADVAQAAVEQLLAVDDGAICGSSLVLVAADGGEEITGRLAHFSRGAPLGVCSDGFELRADGLHASRVAYGGKVVARIVASAGPWFACIRALGLRPGEGVGGVEGADDVDEAAPLVALAGRDCIRASVATRSEPAAGDAVDIGRAALVVAGGRGVGEAGFEAIRTLAAKLDAAWAGSLPTVDAGWVPVSRQVGQSGRHVDPQVYLAIGISGTLQHLAGVGDRARIVAINKDKDADIFRYAEVGIVAPWEDVLPRLIERASGTGRPGSAG